MRVVLVGGFGAPTALLSPLRRRLGEAGFDVSVAPLGLNVGCGEEAVGALVGLLDVGGGDSDGAGKGREDGDGAALVGHSRGGQLARVLAVRRPDLIARLVTVGTPWTIGPPPGRAIEVSSRLLRRWVPAVDCVEGGCCVAFRRDVTAMPTVPWTALWSSSTDHIAGTSARPPDGVDAVDLALGHVALVRHPTAQAAVVDALSD